MSGDDIRHAVVPDALEETPTPLLGDAASDDVDATTALAEALAAAVDARGDDSPSVDPSLVTESLDEILLALIGSSGTETHGTGLMAALEEEFDAELSPGTVYPRLHDLTDEGVLERHELVHTKQYSISDPETARSRVERKVAQHLAIATVLQAALSGP